MRYSSPGIARFPATRSAPSTSLTPPLQQSPRGGIGRICRPILGIRLGGTKLDQAGGQRAPELLNGSQRRLGRLLCPGVVTLRLAELRERDPGVKSIVDGRGRRPLSSPPDRRVPAVLHLAGLHKIAK